MRIHAFRGLRYSTPGETGAHAGPPYDQIDEELRAELHENPRHFAHLIRPFSAREDPHRAAAELHQRWLGEGVISLESAPALYPYEIRLPDGVSRTGICALVGIEDESSDVIRPHEATMDKTVDERLSLLRKTQIDLEPILMLAEDDGRINHLLAEDLAALPPLAQHRDVDSNLHILYRLDDGDRIAIYQQTLASCVGLIADGHHRYTVSRRYAAEIGAQPGLIPAAKLAVVTSLVSPGLEIDPVHRRLLGPLNVEAAAHLAAGHRRISGASGTEIAGAVAAAEQPAIGVSTGDHTELWSCSPDQAPGSLPAHLQHLAVGWLHGALLPELGLAAESATDGTVIYRSDPDRLHLELRENRADVGFWLPPMSADDFARAMTGGELLPPKSTRFLPKLASGLVWAGHDLG